MNLLKNMRISTKLILCFSIIITFLILIGFYGVISMDKIKKEAKPLYLNNTIGISHISDIRANILEIKYELINLKNNQGQGTINKALNSIRVLRNENSDNLNKYKASISKEGEEKAFRELMNSIEVSVPTVDKYINLIESGNFNEANTMYNNVITGYEKVVESSEKLADLNVKWASDKVNNNDNLYISPRLSIVIVTIFTVFVSILLTIVLIKNVRKPLNSAKEFANRLSNYDFSEKLIVQGKNEFSEVADYLNKSQENIASLIKSIVLNSESINDSSESLSEIINEMLSKFQVINGKVSEINNVVQETSSSAEEIAASSEEVDSTTSVLAQKATNGSSNSDEIKERASKSERESREIFETTDKMYKEVEANILKDIEKAKVVEEIKIMAETAQNQAKLSQNLNEIIQKFKV